ncbi:AAA family ATPase [Luteimicrobium sp. DT211]|uniref:AAA family ATPase n=1 Tax=Luteimicrobium sp. DT211 TaxID=3393412 RepID=UPI003CECB7F6
MSDGPRTAPAFTELDRLLLDAKLTVPRRPTTAISRADLIDAARAGGRRVVAVTAPAGYGKSTLLSEWAAREDRAVVWVSLDPLDDAPLNLLVLLASALARSGGGPHGLPAEMAGPGGALLGRAAPRLAAALRGAPRPFVLLLDDLHELRSAECHDVLEVVVGGVPRGSQLVVASRHEQPHLPHLRASGETYEIVARDLELDVAATSQVFASSRVPISRASAEEITRRTEGWPAGIYLASLVARAGDGDDTTVTGADPYVADYLQLEAFRGLAAPLRRFLRRTAVLENLCAELCDAVLAERTSRARLREVERVSLFLVPLDAHRGWFRYHALFREFLLADLLSTEPDLVEPLRIRAADWYEAHGSPARAIEQLLATSARDRCVRLVTAVLMPLFQAGQLATVRRWLLSIGDDAIADYPPLVPLAGYVAVYEGHAVEAERWGRVADATSFDGEMPDGTAAFASARAMFRALRCPEGPARMLADAQTALDAEPAWSAWRDTALTLSGEAHLLVGEIPAARRDLELAVAAAAETGNGGMLVLAEAHLAQLDMDGGRWDGARDHVGRALDAVAARRTDDYPTSALGFAVGARLALHDGDLARTDGLLTRAMRARAFCSYAFPTLAVRSRLVIARTSWARGDVAAVRYLLREIADVLVHRPALGLLADEVADLRKEQDTNTHDRVGAGGGSPLSPAELRLLPYLQTHLTIREVGERLFVSRNTASSQIASIYRKLGVSCRGDAVHRAAAMGLLGA